MSQHTLRKGDPITQTLLDDKMVKIVGNMYWKQYCVDPEKFQEKKKACRQFLRLWVRLYVVTKERMSKQNDVPKNPVGHIGDMFTDIAIENGHIESMHWATIIKR